MKHRDILKEVRNWPNAEISQLVQSLQQVISGRKQKEHLTNELEALATKSGFSMAALGFTREVSEPLQSRKARVLNAANQTYIVTNGTVTLAPPKKMKELRAAGQLQGFNQLTPAQQSQAEALIVGLNSR